MEKQELLSKREELKKQLKELDVELEKKHLEEEIEALEDMTNSLNTMFQDKTLEKHCQDEANQLYEAMQGIDRKVRDLRREIGLDD